MLAKLQLRIALLVESTKGRCIGYMHGVVGKSIDSNPGYFYLCDFSQLISQIRTWVPHE